jgi:immune inhibitor A
MHRYYPTFSAVAVFLLLALSANAVPAKPGSFKVRQKDGTILTLTRYGDEFSHYTRTSDGYTVVQGADGDYCFAKLSSQGAPVSTGIAVRPLNELKPSERAAANASQSVIPSRKNRMSYFPLVAGRRSLSTLRGAPSSSNIPDVNEYGGWGGLKNGSFRTLVILVNFSDVAFTVSDPQGKFNEMLNVTGYSRNGGTGSANDFFTACSNGRFSPIFDVAGPYTLPYSMKYYGGNDSGGNDKNPAQMVLEACQLADPDVDFSLYSENGVIRNIFIFYAGHNEAEGGPEDSIWPHQWEVYKGYNVPDDANLYFDGVLLDGYACSSELRGSSGSTMAGIGTICHEFGHVIKLPDLYDTDYDTNGSGSGLGYASVMDSGCYLNNGCTPPVYGMLERWMLGWAKPTAINAKGEYELEPVYDDKGYLLNSDQDGEYFLLDNRSADAGNTWDYYLLHSSASTVASGLLLFHVDESASQKEKWESNQVNAYGSHQCAFLVKAVTGTSSIPGWFFPGSGNKTEIMNSGAAPSLEGWSGNKNDFVIGNISIDGKNVRFSVSDESDLVQEIQIDKDSVSLAINQTDTINYIQLPLTSPFTKVVFGSGNSSVAKVDAHGVVTAVSEGICTITLINAYNSKAIAMLKVTVRPAISELQGNMGQYDATISWKGEGFTSWKAVCKNVVNDVVVSTKTVTDLTAVNFTLLHPDLEYSFSVFGLRDGKEATNSYSVTGRTHATVTSGNPNLGDIPGTCREDDFITLRLKDMSYYVKTLDWQVDGKTASSTYLKLSKGRHTITAIVKGVDKGTEYLTKFVTVTE